MNVQKPARKPTNVSLDAELIAEAKALGVNISRAAEAGLRKDVENARAAAWLAENAAAIESWNMWYEENGHPLEHYRQV